MNPCVERHTAPFVCRLIRLVAAFGLMLSTLASAAPGGGIIEGRVLNAVTGDYLMNARVVVAGPRQLANGIPTRSLVTRPGAAVFEH